MSDGAGSSTIPDLAGLAERWKGDRRGVLRELLDPSHKIDEKYRIIAVSTNEGAVVTGTVVKRDDEGITLMTNPASPQPVTIPAVIVDNIEKAKASMMPHGLLDRYSRDEIGEILAYILAPDSER